MAIGDGSGLLLADTARNWLAGELGIGLLMDRLCPIELPSGTEVIEEFGIEMFHPEDPIGDAVGDGGQVGEGAALVIWGSQPYALPPFSGERPLHVAGFLIPSQGLWVLGTLIAIELIIHGAPWLEAGLGLRGFR